MALIGCKLCGKLFNPTGRRRVCPNCLKRLDEVYRVVWDYLRDHYKEEFIVEAVADAVGVDVRDVQELVDEGYLDRDLPAPRNSMSRDRREKLAQAFEQSIDKLKATAAASRNKQFISYGQQIYSDTKEGSRA